MVSTQVSALCNLPCGGVPATYLNSQQTASQKTAVFRELAQAFPSCKLLYVTPEQMVKSTTLVEILQKLDSRGLLNGLVIDEVCPALLQITSDFQKTPWLWKIPHAGIKPGSICVWGADA